jgi:cellulase
MAKVSDSASGSPPSSGWFKIYQNTWAKRSGSSNGGDDHWGVKDLNAHCGRLDVRIPTNIASGDYLLRAEVIALHAAGSAGGAQLYMSCYQLTVNGGSGGSPATVSFPGAYRASDPGLQINIYQAMSSYTAPGPAVISGGQEVQAGTGTSVNG